MNSKTIDNIVWWIPFKKLRNNLRDYMHFLYEVSDANKSLKDYIIFPRYIPLSEFEHGFCVYPFRKLIKEDIDFLSKYMNFIKGFDGDSLKIIFDIIEKLCNYNNIDDRIFYSYEELKEFNKFTDEWLEYSSKIIKINEVFVYQKYILPVNHFEPEVFYNKCGMSYVKNINEIKNKNIIDAGGFIGDTAIVLSDYTNKNVYSFEPLLQNYNTMLKTIELNKKNNIIPVNIGLGDANEEISLYHNGNISSGFSIEGAKKSETNSIENKVKMTTLDSYVKENNIEVGLIKTDLEGFEQKFLKGALNTIKEQKPVLLISIYHNYSDFFEIKPMIESLNLGYKFKIIKCKSAKLVLETKLLAQI